MSKTIPVIERLYRNSVINPETGCMEWMGYTDKGGYGRITIRFPDGTHKSESVHRVGWQEWFGPIWSGLWVLHHCDNRRCWRYDHLYLGTVRDNTNDMMWRGRQVSNPKFGEDHKNSRLTWAKVCEIREVHAMGGTSLSKLATLYGVGTKTVHDVVTLRTWTRPR